MTGLTLTATRDVINLFAQCRCSVVAGCTVRVDAIVGEPSHAPECGAVASHTVIVRGKVIDGFTRGSHTIVTVTAKP